MSKVYGVTFMGNVRHIRKVTDPELSMCGRWLCEDLVPHDEYVELNTCQRCESFQQRALARQQERAARRNSAV